METSATRRETSREASGDRCKNIRPSVGRGKIGRRTQSGLGDKGDKWETSVKIMGPRDKWETSVLGQVGDKWKTSVKSCSQRPPECTRRQARQVASGRQVSHHVAKAIAMWQERKPGDKCKSRGPGTQPFQRSKNPSRVNLLGEKAVEAIHEPSLL